MNSFRILLVGDFSGVHSTLREALRNKNLDVTLISDGDSYKNLSSDIVFGKVNKNNKNRGFLKKTCNYLLTLLGVNGIGIYVKNRHKIKQLSSFDVIQLINPHPFQEIGWLINLYIICKLNRKTKKMYLCALGEDYYWVKSCINKRFKYCALDNILGNKRKYRYSLKFLKFYYKILNDYCIYISEKIIPGLVDYKIAYEHFDKCTDVIPLPINKKNITTNTLSLKNNDKVVIFHGWQVGKELKKGNYIFDRAIKKLQEKYKGQIEYIIVKNVPYDEYVKSFSRAHLFIDQCYSYDKGVNALLGMAAGKVVFSGFELEARQYYKFFDDKSTPLINAVPDEDTIFLQLEDLLLNKQKINSISAKAREFILRYHLSDDVADNFLNVWGYDNHD